MNFADFADVRLDGKSIQEVRLNGVKLWPAGALPVFTELHEWVKESNPDFITIDGLKLTAIPGVPERIVRIDPVIDFTLPENQKIYFECVYENNSVAGSSRSGLYGEDVGNWLFSVFSNGSTYLGLSTSAQSGPSFLAFQASEFPVTRQFCFDYPNNRMWHRLVSADGTHVTSWNSDSSADPVAGVGGYDTTGWDTSETVTVWWRIQGDNDVVSLGLHASQFRQAVPAGFNEIYLPAEHAQPGEFTEHHFWEPDGASLTSSVDDGVVATLTAAGWFLLYPTFTKTVGNIYIEFEFVANAASAIDYHFGLEEAVTMRTVFGFNTVSGDMLFEDGDTMCVAVNFTNLKYWIRRNNEPWFNDISEDPETNVGGATIEDPLDKSLEFYQGGDNGMIFRARIHASQYKYAPPAGFGEITLPGEYT